MTVDVCRRCGGTGHEPDHERIGEAMRRDREAAGLTLVQIAERMGVSGSYLSDLERGKRAWHEPIRQRYLTALGVK